MVSRLGQPDLSNVHFAPAFHLMDEGSVPRFSISLGCLNSVVPGALTWGDPSVKENFVYLFVQEKQVKM